MIWACFLSGAKTKDFLFLLYLFQRNKLACGLSTQVDMHTYKHALLTLGLSGYTAYFSQLYASCFLGTFTIKYSTRLWLCPFAPFAIQPSSPRTTLKLPSSCKVLCKLSLHSSCPCVTHWKFITEDLQQKTEHSSNEIVCLHSDQTMYLLWILRAKFTVSMARLQ